MPIVQNCLQDRGLPSKRVGIWLERYNKDCYSIRGCVGAGSLQSSMYFSTVLFCMVQPLTAFKDGSKAAKYREYLHWRTHPFPQYNDIAEIIGNNLAIGDNAFSSTIGSLEPLFQEAEVDAAVDSAINNGDAPEDTEHDYGYPGPDEEEYNESQESSQNMVPLTQVRGIPLIPTIF